MLLRRRTWVHDISGGHDLTFTIEVENKTCEAPY